MVSDLSVTTSWTGRGAHPCPPPGFIVNVTISQHLSTGGSDGEARLMGSGRVFGGCGGGERSRVGGTIQVLAG